MECYTFRYCRRDGTLLSEKEFFDEHQDVEILPKDRDRFNQNVERQSLEILKMCKTRGKIIISGWYKNFIFKDDKTDEFYLMPLDDTIKLFFKSVNPVVTILFYDLKKV